MKSETRKSRKVQAKEKELKRVEERFRRGIYSYIVMFVYMTITGKEVLGISLEDIYGIMPQILKTTPFEVIYNVADVLVMTGKVTVFVLGISTVCVLLATVGLGIGFLLTTYLVGAFIEFMVLLIKATLKALLKNNINPQRNRR